MFAAVSKLALVKITSCFPSSSSRPVNAEEKLAQFRKMPDVLHDRRERVFDKSVLIVFRSMMSFVFVVGFVVVVVVVVVTSFPGFVVGQRSFPPNPQMLLLLRFIHFGRTPNTGGQLLLRLGDSE